MNAFSLGLAVSILFSAPANEPAPKPAVENLKRNYQLLVPKIRSDFQLLFTEFEIKK